MAMAPPFESHSPLRYAPTAARLLIGLALVVLALDLYLAWTCHEAFRPMLTAKAGR